MPSEEGKEVLRLLAEKKIDVEHAYRLLVALGDVPKSEPGERPPHARFGEHAHAHGREGVGGLRGRVLRIRVTEGGRQRVNVSVPVSLARLGRIRGVAAKLERRFGIDLDELLTEIRAIGKVVDVVDEDGDRVEIFVE